MILEEFLFVFYLFFRAVQINRQDIFRAILNLLDDSLRQIIGQFVSDLEERPKRRWWGNKYKDNK